MAKPTAIKPEEAFARTYADRLILEKLSEMDYAVKLGELAEKLSSAGLGLAAVRSLLASNPVAFAYHERKWIPAARLEGEGRSIVESIRLVVDGYGAPMCPEMLALEVARVRHTDIDEAAEIVARITERDPNFIVCTNGQIALRKWSFDVAGESIARALQLHNLDADNVEALKSKLEGIDWRGADRATKAVHAAAPASVKAISAVAWMNLYTQDPKTTIVYDGVALFAELVSIPGYIFGSDGVLYPAAEAAKWVSTAVKLADKIAPTIDVEDAAPIEVKASDIGKMVERIAKSEDSVTALKLLEDFYEITPGTKTFPDDLANVMAALKGESKVWWVGGDRFRSPNSAPDFVYSVPEPFQYVATDNVDEEGELIDVELVDDGLNSSLRKLLLHPLAMDVLDEDIGPAPKMKQDQQRLVLKSIHRELGTFPMAQLATGWIEEAPNIQEFQVIDGNGRELQIWANHEARLLYGWVDWWYEQPTESGSVFTLTKTMKPNVLEFAWDLQTDPVVYISVQRMEELRTLQGISEGKSTLDILIEVMLHWPKGSDFLTLLAEINVVRRSGRRLIASLLSSYQCFYQRSGSPVWHYDAKKVDLGFDKSKKKFVKK